MQTQEMTPKFMEDLTQACAYAMRLTKNRLEYDDIMQDGLMSLLEGGHDLASVDRALVFTIVKRRAIDRVRKLRDIPVNLHNVDGKSHGGAILRTHHSAVDNPQDDLEAKTLTEGLSDYLDELLGQLQGKQHAAASAYYKDGLGSVAAAERLDWSAGVVRKWLMLAREALGDAEGDAELIRRYFHPDARRADAEAVPTQRLRDLVA